MSDPRRDRKGGGGDSRQNDRKHPSSIPGDKDPDVREGRDGEDKKAREVQPGTAEPGTSWQSRSPDPHDKNDKLEQALKDSFPASDPPQPVQPAVTGWDLTEDEKKEAEKKLKDLKRSAA